MPLLSELPGDAAKRDAVLDSSNTTAGPEHRKGMTTKERKAETAAATAAAILGNIFSSTKSVTLGTATQFDENPIVAPHAITPLRPSSTEDEDAPAKSGAPGKDAAKPGAPAKPGEDDAGPSNADLVPWIKLK